MATIYIKDLLLRTEIGFNAHEIGKKQDLLLNITVDYELQGEDLSDNADDALNYKTLCKDVIDLIEGDRFNLLERAARKVMDYLMGIDRVEKATVEIDKPNALRFSRSVSFAITSTK